MIRGIRDVGRTGFLHMNAPFRLFALAALLCTGAEGTTAAPQAGEGAMPPPAAAKSPADACESAVAEMIRGMRGPLAQEIQFVVAKRVLLPTAGDETGVTGEGRYQARTGSAMPFTYSCAFNPKTGTASGAVFRETGTRPSAAEQPWQPDLTHLSPEACEAAAAAALKDKYPGIGRVSIETDQRKLRPAPGARTSLEGRGGLQRAVGLNTTPFTYRCDIETDTGKILSVQTAD